MYLSPHQVSCLYTCFFCVYMDMYTYLHDVHVHMCMYTCEVPRVPCILLFEGLQWTGIYWVQCWMADEPWGSTCLHLPIAKIANTLSTPPFLFLFFFLFCSILCFFLLKHCNQVLLLIRQTLCQLCHLPNPVVVLLLFVCLFHCWYLTVSLLLSLPSEQSFLLSAQNAPLISSSWSTASENVLYASVKCWYFWITVPVCQSNLHDALGSLHFARLGGIISCSLLCSECTVSVEQNKSN